MHIISPMAIAFAATAVTLAPAAGQTPGFCDVTDPAYFLTIAPMLEGTWQVKAVAGHTLYREEIMTMPVEEFPALPPMNLSFDEARGQLAMTSSELPEPLPLSWEEGRTLFPDVESHMPPALSSEEELNILAGCDDGQLPILSATGLFPFGDGLKEDTYRLVIIDETMIHGIIRSQLTYNGAPMFGRMEIILTR